MIQPITKTLSVITISIALIVALCDIKHLFILTYSPFLSEWRQFYRVLILQLAFVNESEVLITMMIFFKLFNDIERLFGFYKFLAVLSLSYFYNLLVNFIQIFLIYQTTGVNYKIGSGPIGIIFTVLCFYNDMIPSTYKFAFNFGTHKLVLNDKSFVLALALMLLINQGFSTLIPSINGWLIGKLISSDILPGRNVTLYFLRRQLHNYYLKTHLHQRRLAQIDAAGAAVLSNNNSNNNNSTESITNNATTGIGDEEEDEATPARPFGSQLLDTFRR